MFHTLRELALRPRKPAPARRSSLSLPKGKLWSARARCGNPTQKSLPSSRKPSLSADVAQERNPGPGLHRRGGEAPHFYDARLHLDLFDPRLPRRALRCGPERRFGPPAASDCLDPGSLSSDSELVERMARGDRLALALLYERHAPRLCAVARQILGQADEAEDLLHDVFLEAWRHAGDYVAARGSVWSWLCIRTRSRAIDRRRSAPRAQSIESLEVLANFIAAEVDSDTAPDRRKLREALIGMSRDEREVLALGYFEGLSSSEIATRIQVPIGTVKSRTRSALAKLRQRLAPREGFG
ncbi:MAG: sigma-70 family RNA polymerase sigma factor [Myxococcota bacterium]